MNNDAGFRILQVAYLGIAARDLDAWRSYAADYLGMQVVEQPDDAIVLRMDERCQRVLVELADRDGLNCIGLEVQDRVQLLNAATSLGNAGYVLRPGSAKECDLRGVSEMLWFDDSDRNRVELFYGPITAKQAFKPARPIGGFRTGDLGFGHLVLKTTSYPAMKRLYMDLLGFRLSDYLESPFEASFMHVNGRHHSLAIIKAAEAGLHHLMVEYNYIDDVGRLYDMALQVPERISVTLGRHTNDHMLSFYSKTPGGFMIETGWAGRLIDDATWIPEKLSAPSLWGHERSWLPLPAREETRKQRDELARQGILTPTEVIASTAFNLAGLKN